MEPARASLLQAAGAAASSAGTSSRTTRASTGTQSSRSPRPPRRRPTPSTRSEEAEHVVLWDEFAAAFGADTTREPSPETAECVVGLDRSGNRLEALAVMYAIEAGQPAVSQTKLDGLADALRRRPRTSRARVLRSPLGARPRACRRVAPRPRVGGDGAGRRRLVEEAEAALRGNWTPAGRSRSQEVAMRFLLRGLPGHPLHPPLTDATIGAYTFAAAMAVLSRLGRERAQHGDRLVARPDRRARRQRADGDRPGSSTGSRSQRGTPLWRTATLHMGVMLAATIVFAITAGAGHADYVDGVGRRRVADPDARRLRRADDRWAGSAAPSSSCTGCACSSSWTSRRRRAVSPAPQPEKEEAEA